MSPSGSDKSGRRYKNYLVMVLMIVLTFTYIERVAFSVALQAIKSDLNLTDSQLGLIMGLGFALFFAIAGIPIARWADRGHRVLIVSLAMLLWSVTVGLSTIAQTFVWLFVIRIGVAAGEAGCQPPANSLIPEYFDRAERPRAVARYLLGSPIGLIVGYFAGGWLVQLCGWRTTFLVIGAPGLVIALLTALTLKEPRYSRKTSITMTAGSAATEQISAPGFRETIVVLSRNVTLRHLLAAFLVWYFCGWALAQWLPTFLIRSHGLSIGEIGTWLSVVHGACGLVGTWIGGEWSSRYAVRNERLQIRAVSGVFVGLTVANLGILLAPGHRWALMWVAMMAMMSSMANGPLFAALQSLVPGRMRATAMALVALFPSFIGMGLGPLAAGVLSDALHAWAGEQSLRCALLFLCPGYCWAAWHLLRASRTVANDVAAADLRGGEAVRLESLSDVDWKVEVSVSK